MKQKAKEPASEEASGDIRIGVSGWTYAPWRGSFYPKGLPQNQELAHASWIFPSIEINGTFYSLQTPDTFQRWVEATPEDFIFAVKGPKFITHIKRLREAEIPLANFWASGVLKLGEKLGPLLWQLPPNFKFDAERLETFFALLPKDTEAAAACAANHNDKIKAPAWAPTDRNRPLRHALEIRHESFCDPSFIRLLRKYNVALVCADTVKWPLLMDVTADFVYCRLHGSRELYKSGYEDDELDQWAARIEAWATGRPMRDGHFIGDVATKQPKRDVFLYFDNTDKLMAPSDAQSLMQKLGVGAQPWIIEAA